MKVGEVWRTSAPILGLHRSRLQGRQQRQHRTHTRNLAVILCRRYGQGTQAQIGEAIGLSRATVNKAIATFEDRCADPDFFRHVATVCAVLESEITARRIAELNRPAPCIMGLLPPPQVAA